MNELGATNELRLSVTMPRSLFHEGNLMTSLRQLLSSQLKGYYIIHRK